MAVFSGGVLSGSSNGRPIPVAATATPGTLIHTVGAGTTGFDEVMLFASNITVTAATLTIEFGGTTDPGDHVVKAMSIPANSQSIPICAGQRLNNGLVIRAFSGTASAINISGGFNRTT